MPPQSSTLTRTEELVLMQAWKCMDTEPKMNYQKLAELRGCTNPRSAQNVLGAAKKKIRAMVAAEDATNNNATQE
ncbi:hypothetical protein F5X97DRAFT_327301 [Nemania serpens]|nr:hypothetical protein F5X97DRAFT_327301 [Nemania serpens]